MGEIQPFLTHEPPPYPKGVVPPSDVEQFEYLNKLNRCGGVAFACLILTLLFLFSRFFFSFLIYLSFSCVPKFLFLLFFYVVASLRPIVSPKREDFQQPEGSHTHTHTHTQRGGWEIKREREREKKMIWDSNWFLREKVSIPY